MMVKDNQTVFVYEVLCLERGAPVTQAGQDDRLRLVSESHSASPAIMQTQEDLAAAATSSISCRIPIRIHTDTKRKILVICEK